MDKLVNCLYKRPDAVTRLICFPWAGGGSLFNAQWGRLFDESVEVLSLRLPGRESRIGEPLPDNFDELLDEIIEGLLPLLCEKRFAFFGHSFGSSTCYGTAVKLKQKHGLEPIHLFLSGASAPHSAARYSVQKRLELSDEEFLKWMTSTQGTPPALLKNKEAMQLFLTPLKADLKLVANYVYEKPSTPALSCGLTCFDGTEDTPHDLAAWKDLTSGDFSIHMLPGGHFYLKDPTNEKSLVQYISRYIEAAEIHYF